MEKWLSAAMGFGLIALLMLLAHWFHGSPETNKILTQFGVVDSINELMWSKWLSLILIIHNAQIIRTQNSHVFDSEINLKLTITQIHWQYIFLSVKF